MSDFLDELQQSLEDPRKAMDFGEAMAKVDVAYALSRARSAKGLTQKELATRLGTSQSYIAKLERGDANPSVGTVGRMFAALGLRLSPELRPLGQRRDLEAPGGELRIDAALVREGHEAAAYQIGQLQVEDVPDPTTISRQLDGAHEPGGALPGPRQDKESASNKRAKYDRRY